MRIAVAVCLIVASSLAISSAQAQPTSGFHSAGWKQGVDTYWPARSASRAIDNAREYAQDFQNYVTKMPAPEPSVVKDVKVELARYLDEAAKHLATMKKDFAGDKEISSAIAAIEKDLATAVANHKSVIECCEHEKFDKAAGMTCCKDMVKDFDKVHAAHAELMKKLAAKAPKTAKPAK
jgi:hypothetical protein